HRHFTAIRVNRDGFHAMLGGSVEAVEHTKTTEIPKPMAFETELDIPFGQNGFTHLLPVAGRNAVVAIGASFDTGPCSDLLKNIEGFAGSACFIRCLGII